MRLILILIIFILIACNNQSKNPCIPPTFSTVDQTNNNMRISEKRAPPKIASPVSIDSIIIYVSDSMVGGIVAKSIKTDSTLWTKQIYEIKYDKDMEEDVQWVFIDSMVYDCKYLYIHNEKNAVYRLDLTNLHVTKP